MFLEVLVALLAVMALALGVLLLMRIQEDRWRPRHHRWDDREIIIRESPGWGWGRGWGWWNRPLGPYYSHLPVRPLLY